MLNEDALSSAMDGNIGRNDGSSSNKSNQSNDALSSSGATAKKQQAGRKHSSNVMKRERNIEAITSTTTTMAWLQQNRVKREEEVKATRVGNYATSKRQVIQRQSSHDMRSAQKKTSLFLCFGFSFFICLFVVQLLYVEIMMDHTGHFSIHSIQKMILRKPQQPKTTSSPSANTTTTSKMIHAADILLSTQLLSVPQNMQENGVSIPSSEIPSVEDMEKLYGKHARIYGLKDSCPAFRASVVEEERLITPAGMFNTGTNLIFELLKRNCCMKARQAKYGNETCGIRFQVPWGKHSPVSFRLKHDSEWDHISHTNSLPVVVIKDPYTWMSSMCRHSYSADWKRNATHCPNLAGNNNTAVPVTLDYPKNSPMPKAHYKSLIHLWNSYYNDYLNKTNAFPFLVIRFEDILFFPKDIVTEVCHCAGGVMYEPFRPVKESAKSLLNDKAHEGSSGLTAALMLYGNATKRRQPFIDQDLKFIREHVSQELIQIFNYNVL